MNCDKKSMLLYAVTDRSWLNGRTLAEDVEKALKGGVSMVQLREKNCSYDQFLKEAFEIKALCKKYNVPFIINDDVKVAIACDADGIHVGQNDIPAQSLRTILGKNKIIGVSAQTVEQAKLAEKQGADYLGVGAVFATSTKLDANSVSHKTVSDICKAVSIPVCAIGGISKENMLQLKGTGIDGVALVSAIFAVDNIEIECRELSKLSAEMVGI